MGDIVREGSLRESFLHSKGVVNFVEGAGVRAKKNTFSVWKPYFQKNSKKGNRLLFWPN